MSDTDTARELGSISARLDGHDAQLASIHAEQTAGFAIVNQKLDSLRSAEQRRKGALNVAKFVGGSGLLVGVLDIITRLLKGHS